jgi:NodT family efflux transporter outer membrane factor (OMF) lipoprotein
VPTEELRQQALEHAAIPGQWSARDAATGPVSDTWLSSFADPQLEALVNEALLYNADLRAAAARVEQAAGYLKVAGAPLWPTLSAVGTTGSKSGAGGGLDIGMLQASWELDLWGRIRAGRSAAEYEYVSAGYEFSYARQSLAALVVKSWYATVEAWLQHRLAEETAGAAQELVQLARERQRIGPGDVRDVAIASQSAPRRTVSTSSNRVTRRRCAYWSSAGSLSRRGNRVPRDLPTALPLPVGLPSELLERRPDVIAAERRVTAAFNLTQEAKAARLPSIKLTAGLSWISSELLELKQRDNPRGSIGVSLLAPLFRGGELQAQVEIRTAEQQEAVAEYGGVALAAFGDVENALTGEFLLAQREPLLAAAVQDNQQALTLSETQYRVGKIDLRAVKAQQVELYQARMQWLRLQNERIAQRVNLYLALGGDFAGRQPVSQLQSGSVIAKE